MIHTLEEGLVSHLAAGEVVERPSSIIRECIDNSIDAHASKIQIETVDSGTASIIIDDNGSGIDKSDLLNIALPHSTSKISKLDDIYDIHTMGFRGEALFSMRSVGDLTIESNGEGISFKSLERGEIFKSTKEKGCRITLKNLFASLPARKAFLSSPSSENKRNRDLVEEKALAFPDTEFVFKNNDKELIHFNKETQSERLSHFFNTDMEYRIRNVEKAEDDFSVSLYYAENAIRGDKRKIKIYVNNRAVSDAYLMSAVLYAFSKIVPGGAFPLAVVFITNDTTLTDFNVHPQKRECRLRNASSIHRCIAHIFSGENDVFGIKDAIVPQQNGLEKTVSENDDIDSIIKNHTTFNKNDISYKNTEQEEDFPMESSSPTDVSVVNRTLQSTGETRTTNPSSTLLELDEKPHFQYIGQLWNLFLLYTIGDTLYIMDQHAAAERVLFDSLKNNTAIQELLFPFTIEVEKEISEILDKNLALFRDKGIIISKKTEGEWVLEAIPGVCKNNEREIIDLIKNANDAEIDEKLYAIIACHNSIRKGDRVGDKDAIDLIEKALELDSPTCPHGRTFITKIEKNALETLVMRE